MSRRSKIDMLKQRHEFARLTVESARMEHAAKVFARYDVLDSNRFRRQPVREQGNEGDIYDMTKRLNGCNLGRDLERNYSPAKAMLHQFRVNVVGSLGKLRVNVKGGPGDDSTAWFNEVWAKDCDFRDDADFSTILGNILASEIRDGDVLSIIDDNLIEDTGKLLTWESDQVAPVSPDVLKSTEYSTNTQDNGILRDKWGRVVAFCATGKRGLPVIDKKEDVTFWKREQARLARNPWRLNQGRGVPSLITSSSNLIDLYEMLASELMSAKRAAKQYAFVKRENAVTDWDSPASGPEFLPENDGRSSADVAADGANQTTHTAANYERLEAFTGGLTDYLDPKDSVEFPKLDHPNGALAAFLETVHGYGGASLGLARAYTILRADSSYTAFRGDMILSWTTFYWLQKHLERVIADWVAIRVLRWAQRKKLIPALPSGWERTLSWTWPTMPEVDELDAQNAIAASLKNGTTDYSQLLGPDWKQRLAGLAAQIDEIRRLGIPLSILEAKSGGLAAAADNPKKDENAVDEKITEATK